MKKLELKTLIRGIVREEVQLEIRKVLKENKSVGKRTPTKSKPTSEKPAVKPNGAQPLMSSNPVLNDILQETARDSGEWPTLGDHTMTTSDVDTIANRQVPDQGPNTDIVRSMGVDPNRLPDHITSALTKDYREVMKVVDQKIAAKKI